MNVRPSDGRDQPEAVDEVMLALLSNRGRNATVLTVDQERLLDEWVDGRLAPDATERAVALVRQNSLAAERVLERRLLTAAAAGPSVPQALAAHVLRSTSPPAPLSDLPRPSRRWRWLALAGAIALASIVVTVGVPLWRETMQDSAPTQVAMVTIGDRTPLFEPSDIRTRGTAPQQNVPGAQRFSDVEVPKAVLQAVMAAKPGSAALSQFKPYLPSAGQDDHRPVALFVDAALKERVDAGDGRDRMAVRIYDLEDPRAADIRSLAGALPDGARSYLLTLKP
jgi:hypothetical protein